jgi:ATP/maltotriose-dependent transcriptional regulator MalT
MLAYFGWLVGDVARSVDSWRIICDWFEAQGNLSVLSTFAPTLGRARCLLGQYDEAEPLAQRGRELGDEQDAITQMMWRQVQALVLSHRGQHAEAERLEGEAVAIAEGTDALNWHGDALCDLAEVLRNADRTREAAVALQEALTLYERKRNLPMVERVRQILRTLTGGERSRAPGYDT